MNKKNCFKKIISLTLALFVLFNMSFAFSADNKDTAADSEITEIMDVLRLLGIIPDYYDYNADFNGKASRADFSDAVYKIMNTGTYSTETLYYYDVPKTHWAFDAISYLTERKIIGGSSDKLFEPDADIKQTEAYKILITAMGYGEYAENNGGYPSGYIKAASMTKISLGIPSKTDVTRRDMFVMLYNAMLTNIMESDSYTADGNTYRVNKDETFLSINQGIYYNTGVLTAAEQMGIKNIIPTEDDEVIIDDKQYKSDINLADFLGENIEVLYRYDRTNDEKRIIRAKKSGVTESLSINAEKDTSFDSDSYTLKYIDENDKSKTVQISRSATFVYNGREIGDNISKALSDVYADIKLIKNDAQYDVVIIKEYFNIVADIIDTDSKTIYDKVNPSKNISLDEDKYDKLNIWKSDTQTADFEDITKGNIISAYISKDGTYADVYISGKTAEGTVSQISTEGGDTYLYIENIGYKCIDQSLVSTVKAGDKAILYLDRKNHIAYADVPMSGSFAAYLINSVISDDFSPKLKAKYLKEDGKIEYADFAEKAKVDGVTYKTAAEIMKALTSDGSAKSRLMLCKTDSEGNIKEADTSTRDSRYEGENTLQTEVGYKTSQRYKSSGVIGALINMDSNTKVFCIPSKGDVSNDDEKDFAVLGYNTIDNDTFLNAESYKTTEDGGMAKYVCIYNYNMNRFKSATLPVLVSDVSDALNSNGQSVKCLNGYQDGNAVSFKAEEDFDIDSVGITSGCFVRVALNSDNEITQARVLYDPSKTDGKTSSSDINNDYRTVVGYANCIADGVMYIGENSGGEKTLGIKTSGLSVLVYDSTQREKVKTGTVNEAKIYKNYADDCSKVVLLTRFMAPAVLVIYK